MGSCTCAPTSSARINAVLIVPHIYSAKANKASVLLGAGTAGSGAVGRESLGDAVMLDADVRAETPSRYRYPAARHSGGARRVDQRDQLQNVLAKFLKSADTAASRSPWLP